MFILVNKKTQEIERVETDRFHFDSINYDLVETSFENYNGKLYYRNNKIEKK